MPPRLPPSLTTRHPLGSSLKLLPAATPSATTIYSTPPSSSTTTSSSSSSLSSPFFRCSQCRSFTTTQPSEYRIARAWDRRLFFMAKGKGRKYGMDLFYREGAGSKLKTSTPGQPNYLGIFSGDGKRQTAENQPFPANPYYTAHPVLSDGLRREVWRRVVEEGKGVRRVSAELGIELERVGACVRLMEIENNWVKDGKELAGKLTSALHSMMPVTDYHGQRSFSETVSPHETISDVLQHPATTAHNFATLPESTRVDRQRAGDMMGILPTHLGMPHAELVEIEKEKLQGLSADDQKALEDERVRLEESRREDKKERDRIRKEGWTLVETDRWRFRLKEAKTGDVGFLYGANWPDRRRAQIKIPTRVL